MSIVKLPSKSVTTPLLVPLIMMFAPGIGLLEVVSVTVPVTDTVISSEKDFHYEINSLFRTNNIITSSHIKIADIGNI